MHGMVSSRRRAAVIRSARLQRPDPHHPLGLRHPGVVRRHAGGDLGDVGLERGQGPRGAGGAAGEVRSVQLSMPASCVDGPLYPGGSDAPGGGERRACPPRAFLAEQGNHLRDRQPPRSSRRRERHGGEHHWHGEQLGGGHLREDLRGPRRRAYRRFRASRSRARDDEVRDAAKGDRVVLAVLLEGSAQGLLPRRTCVAGHERAPPAEHVAHPADDVIDGR